MLRRSRIDKDLPHPELQIRSGAISVQDFMIFMRRLEVDMGGTLKLTNGVRVAMQLGIERRARRSAVASRDGGRR